MKHQKRFYLFFSILTLVFLLTLTSCQTAPVLYNVNTMYTATAFGFTDDGAMSVHMRKTAEHFLDTYEGFAYGKRKDVTI